MYIIIFLEYSLCVAACEVKNSRDCVAKFELARFVCLLCSVSLERKRSLRPYYGQMYIIIFLEYSLCVVACEVKNSRDCVAKFELARFVCLLCSVSLERKRSLRPYYGQMYIIIFLEYSLCVVACEVKNSRDFLARAYVKVVPFNVFFLYS